MSPITATGFQLGANGKFEAQRLEEPSSAPKLSIAPNAAASKLAIESAQPKLAIGAQPSPPSTAAPAAAPPNAASAAQGAPNQKVDPKLAKVSREFEAIFLRNLLKPLEKAGSSGSEGSVSSGSSVYGSMMVGALADSASQGGGIGLAHLVLEALTRGAAAQKTSK